MTAGRGAAPAAGQLCPGCCGPRSPRRRCRACAARPRSADSPSLGSRAPAAGSARAPHSRSAGALVVGVNRSSAERRAGDASAGASLALPGKRSSCAAAAPGSAPQAAADREVEPRLADLPAKNRQLVAEHENLQLLRPVTAPDEHHQLQQSAGENVQRRHKQRRPPADGAADVTSGSSASAPHPTHFCTPRGLQ
jgi:hypothetical protein